MDRDDTRRTTTQAGGDAGVRALVDRFYDLMDTAPEAATIRALHAANLKVSREKLYKYLSGWLGGPPLYESRVRPSAAAHAPLPISHRAQGAGRVAVVHGAGAGGA